MSESIDAYGYVCDEFRRILIDVYRDRFSEELMRLIDFDVYVSNESGYGLAVTYGVRLSPDSRRHESLYISTRCSLTHFDSRFYGVRAARQSDELRNHTCLAYLNKGPSRG